MKVNNGWKETGEFLESTLDMDALTKAYEDRLNNLTEGMTQEDADREAIILEHNFLGQLQIICTFAKLKL